MVPPFGLPSDDPYARVTCVVFITKSPSVGDKCADIDFIMRPFGRALSGQHVRFPERPTGHKIFFERMGTADGENRVTSKKSEVRG